MSSVGGGRFLLTIVFFGGDFLFLFFFFWGDGAIIFQKGGYSELFALRVQLVFLSLFVVMYFVIV